MTCVFLWQLIGLVVSPIFPKTDLRLVCDVFDGILCFSGFVLTFANFKNLDFNLVIHAVARKKPDVKDHARLRFANILEQCG